MEMEKIVSAEVVTEKPKSVVGMNALAVFDPAHFPDEPLSRVRKHGDLINSMEMTPPQIAQAQKIVLSFSLADTAAVLRFAEEPQKKLSAYLDELLAGIKVGQAGVAGDIAKQLAGGIDMMQLDKVKQQIVDGRGGSFVANVLEKIGLVTDYLKNFYLSKQPILTLIQEIENKASNRIAILQRDTQELDHLVNVTVNQIRDLAAWLLAGEAILVEARKQYLAKREEVLTNQDPVEAAKLRDMSRQLAAFETRVVKAEIAYVKAASVNIPRIRSVEESMQIEIQNISEQILFQLPDFKSAIVVIAALNDTKHARDERLVMEENQRHLDTVLDEAVNDAARLAKESQGDPLKMVQDLEKTINIIKAGIEEGIKIESEARQRRVEAHTLLVSMKDVVTDALKQANIEAAHESV